jgi:hypothetical protein
MTSVVWEKQIPRRSAPRNDRVVRVVELRTSGPFSEAEPHPFDFAQGRLCRKERDKDGAPKIESGVKPKARGVRIVDVGIWDVRIWDVRIWGVHV